VYIILFYRNVYSMISRIKTAEKIIGFCGCMFCLLVMQAACTSQQKVQNPPTLTVFAGSASQPVLQELSREYRKQTGTDVELIFGGSGFVLSQMQLVGRGDIYMPGSSDFMAKAVKAGLVNKESICTVAYLVPAINVKPGNPENIKSLADLSRPGLRIGIARPEQVCLGLYAIELLEYNELLESVLPNIAATFESCAKTASAIAITDLDAVIGWREFQSWEPRRIESVLIHHPEIVPRVGAIPIAVTTLTKDPVLANTFIDFVCSMQGKEFFQKRGYITSASKVLKFAPNARIGGGYNLPSSWKNRNYL
jgi:molybdate transport system substrate-binding protein